MFIERKSIFDGKPKHARERWTLHNAIRAERRRTNLILWHEQVVANRARRGFASLRSKSKHRKLFASVPRRLRHIAEAHLNRKLNEYYIAHGHAPSRQKYASMCANAAYTALYCATGKTARWRRHTDAMQREWDKLTRERARAMRPAELTARADPPKARSSFRLPGV